MAHPCNTLLCEGTQRRSEIDHHDIHRVLPFALRHQLHSRNQSKVRKTRCEEPIYAGLGIDVRPLNCLCGHRIVMLTCHAETADHLD